MGIERPRNGGSIQQHNQVTLGTAAPGIQITPDLSVSSRQDVTILNIDTAITIYIGNSGLTSSTGFPLIAGASITRRFSQPVFGIAASGTPKVAYITSED